MKVRRATTIAGLCAFIIWQAALDAAGAYTLGRGRQIMLDRGLQIQGPLAGSAVGVWADANYSAVNWWNGIYGGPYLLPNTPWGKQAVVIYDHPETKYLSAAELQYVNNCVALQWAEEPGVNYPPWFSVGGAERTRARDDMAWWQANYPTALTYTVFLGNPNVIDQLKGAPATVAHLQTYQAYCNPDMLMFDYYPSFSFDDTSRNVWYRTMSRYRTAGLKGNNGDGLTPIPYGQWMNMYRPSYSDPLPSESYVRLQRFASLAFGYTFLEDFIYNYTGIADVKPVMFKDDGVGASSKTVVFDYVAEANRQSRNLGPALARLVSTDIRMIPRSDQSLATEMVPWAPGAGSGGGYTDYITAITPITGLGGGESTSYSDVLVGYFKPLLASNPLCTFVDGLHFMIVNGGANGTLDALKQWYRVNFNFGSSGYDKLVRLDRDTGQVVPVTLISDGGSYYHYDFSLEGGTGDLFCFWNSSTPLPTIPEPGTLVILATGLGFGAFYVWRRRRFRISGFRFHSSQ